jgi:predicted AAA+ superfamily ATPase
MFASDWQELPDDPTEEQIRALSRRQRERRKAARRFQRRFPDLMERLGRAVALQRERLAIEILTGEK